MINKDGDIRTIVQDLIIGNKKHESLVNKNNINRPELLLIDEVDVFFCKDFYGNVYSLAAPLKDPTISALIDFIY